LHDRSKLACTYARTTRNCLTIPWKAHRVEWLGYFWVELLSPARSGLGLGSVILSYFTMLSPCMLVACSPDSMKGFGVMGLELCSVDSDSLRPCPVDSGSLWLVIMPKSKDRFME
jgi:hypothetical protein